MELPINYDKVHHSVRKKAREKYVELQEGFCWFCHTSLEEDPAKEVMDSPINKKLFPIGMFNFPIHLHHDHNTGLTIGAVHARCNAYLWQYRGQ